MEMVWILALRGVNERLKEIKNDDLTFSHSNKVGPSSSSGLPQTIHSSTPSTSGYLSSSLNLSFGVARKIVKCAPAAILNGDEKVQLPSSGVGRG